MRPAAVEDLSSDKVHFKDDTALSSSEYRDGIPIPWTIGKQSSTAAMLNGGMRAASFLDKINSADGYVADAGPQLLGHHANGGPVQGIFPPPLADGAVDNGTDGIASANDKPPSADMDKWYYPVDIANDLQGVPLPQGVKEEIFATAFEYARSVVPSYSNWPRYVAFMRIFIMGIIAEFKGELVDVTAGDDVLGYDLQNVLDTLFAGTPGHAAMCREYRTFLLVTAEKTSQQGELFRRYVNALAHSPRQWFRIRDTDALARFTIASALACNDIEHVWFTDEQFEILSEIGDTMYDAIAYFKHRSEAETNSTFAYMPADLRVRAFRECREMLWALDAAWARRPELAVVANFVRTFGGPIHMMMRRYRFVEEDLTIGRQENAKVIDATRRNYKLWNRVDASDDRDVGMERYRASLAQESKLMFAGLADALEAANGQSTCPECRFRDFYGCNNAESTFGGVELCTACKESNWRPFFETFKDRATRAFPELILVLK